MNALELRGLTKHYGGFTLDHLDLTLPQGCIMGLVGENGAGKTTAIKLILGMIRRDGGTVRVFGEEIASVKEEIGVVLDQAGIPSGLNARQVGRVMADIYRNWDQAEYERLIRKLRLPEDKAFKELSQGMKMKLGIAVALAHHPKLLILDEATNGLDPVVRDEVVQMFSEFTRDEDHAVLISTHIVSDLEKICDYIAFIHEGRLMICEEKDALKERYGVIRCTAEELAAMDPEAVLGRKESPYGIEAVVRREAVPGMTVSPVELEQLFICMVKEGRA